MKTQTLTKKYLPQNQDIEVLVPNYKEPILPVNRGGFGWYGLMAYNEQGQLMCHECGKFFDSLSCHIKIHGLNPRQYKTKYQLFLKKTRLISDSVYLKSRSIILARPDYIIQATTRLLKYTKSENETREAHKRGQRPLEFFNRYNTCSEQLLRRLLDITKIYGLEVTRREVEICQPGFSDLLIRRFGSFNEPKRLVKLSLNYGNQIRYNEQIIVADMVCFYFKYGRWPVIKDYINGNNMICHDKPLRRYGGIKALRQEAMKLREEQEAARIRGEQVAQYANKIEMEFAGTARR